MDWVLDKMYLYTQKVSMSLKAKHVFGLALVDTSRVFFAK